MLRRDTDSIASLKSGGAYMKLCNFARPAAVGALIAGLAVVLSTIRSAHAADQSASAEKTDRPNILLIMADDVGRETLGCYGGTSYKTPQLDRLAEAGMRLTHCYSMPVCHPTRVCLMTGRYPFRYGARWGSFPNQARTLAHALKDAGYATAVAGKWQLVLQKTNPDHPRQLGFDDSCLFGWHEGPRFHQPYIWENGRRRPDLEEPDVFGPDVYTEFLIDFMSRNRDKPFLAYFPMALCHEISDDFLPPPPPGPDGKYLDYRQMIETMDTLVGRLVTALERLELREKTVVLFTTDNGSPRSYLTHLEQRDGKVIRHHAPVVSEMDGRQIRGGKGSLTDAGTRVPLIANWPGTIKPGQVVDDLVDFSDFLPTLAELAKARLPRDPAPDGHSFAVRLRGQGSGPREWVFCEQKNRQWVRNRHWKLYNDGRLFDMQNDPDETKPLAESDTGQESAVARRQLTAALQTLN
jgi:arylsulfatase A